MSTTILRVEKIKSFANIKRASAHNKRTIDVPNCDHNKIHLNEILIGSGDGEKDIKSLIDKHKLKVRKNSVIAYDGLLTLSPDAFDKISVEDFKKAALEFLDSEFKGRVTTAYLHLDESTPHVQFYMCPIVKNKGDAVARLSARDYMNKKKMGAMQRRFYKHMAASLPGATLSPPNHGSTAEHTKISHFYELLQRDQDALVRDVVSNLQAKLEGAMSQKFDTLLQGLDAYILERIEKTSDDMQAQLKSFYSKLREESKALKFEDKKAIEDVAFVAVNDEEVSRLINESVRESVSKKGETRQRSNERSLKA